MRRMAARYACAVLIVLGCGLAAAEDERTLAGRYVWNATGEGGELEAVFSPSGEGKWAVDFRFSHGGEQHVYSGTAEGSLSGGELSGLVKTRGGGRQFTFEMKFEDGRFRGTHAEVTDGRKQPTGTLSLG